MAKKRARRNRKVTLILDDHDQQTPFVTSKVAELRDWMGTERDLLEEAAAVTGMAIDDIVRAGARTEAQRLIANAKGNETLQDTRGRAGVRDDAFEETFTRLVREYQQTGEKVTPSRLNHATGMNHYRSAERFLRRHYSNHPAVMFPKDAKAPVKAKAAR